MSLLSLLLVACGGALGAVARHLSVIGMGRLLGPEFPYGTITVNITGSFLMGLLVGYIIRTQPETPILHLFFVVGVLGGFTTFSTFSMDAVAMLERGQMVPALVYVLGSVVLSLVALMAGLWLLRAAA